MKLSIIIVNYNTEKLLKNCIDSIYESDSRLSFEIVVVDNGSTDGSVENIRVIQGLKLIENKVNLGFAKACNQGIKAAKGKYLLLLNSDTQMTKGAMEELISFAEKNPDVGVVGAQLLNPDRSVQGSVFREPTIKRAILQSWLDRGQVLAKYAPIGTAPSEVEILTMAAFLITPKALKKVGLLDDRYFMYFEDFDYCRRVRNVGLKVYYLPASKVIHIHGASGKNLVKDEMQWKRLIPSSKIYYGILKYFLLNFILWIGQKWQKLVRKS